MDLLKEFINYYYDSEEFKKKHKCLTCYWYTRIPTNMDPCYSCSHSYDKWKPVKEK